MTKFKVGNKVEWLSCSYSSDKKNCAKFVKHGDSPERGWQGEIVSESDEGWWIASYTNPVSLREMCMATTEENLKLISSNNKTNMTLIEKIRLATKSEPEKSFITAGITTMAGDFTSEGKEAFFMYLLEKNKDDFDTTVVQPLIEADKKD